MVGDSEETERTPVDHSPVDQAGVRRVVEVERAAGRHPEVMPHENPGFDVISRDGTGRILRHIEVKSTASGWDDMGVGLTRTQFDFAQQNRETFWLYVVEHALDDNDARVMRIADPIGRADEFRFDDGWSVVSEDVDTTDLQMAEDTVPEADSIPEGSIQRIVIRLTQGNLSNSHVYLRNHLDFFPADAIGAANAKDGEGKLLTVYFAGLAEPVETDITGDHKSFRCRGAWREFFAHHRLVEGDSVAIERQSAYEYRVVSAG